MNDKIKPFMLLKFGRIKFADFNEDPEAMRLHDELDLNDKSNMVKVVEAFNGDFKLWWENNPCTKKEAIDYILNYDI